MKVLIIGDGGREHALAWKVAQSSHVSDVYVAPGNAGTELELNLKNVAIHPMNIPMLLNFAQQKKIDLTIVGPEAPLMLGIVDEFRAVGLKIYGPTKFAAQLESSKTFAKHFFIRHNIPTAEYKSFNEIKPALDYLYTKTCPIVIKADGLAGGKGVTVAMNHKEAEISAKNILKRRIFGNAGNCVVIEEFLHGEEASFIVMTDGKHALPMATSQDHKRVGENDTGPNTGGMGAYSPACVVTDQVYQFAMERIISPTIKGMEAEGNLYTGFLYVGLIIDKETNIPKVVEFNCRFGDPEAQPIMLRMKSDLVELCIAACNGKLNECTLQWDARVALGVVIATKDYPGNYSIGNKIYGLPLVKINNAKIFHSGTRIDTYGRIVTNGGRVLCITTLGNTVAEAQKYAYSLVKNIYWNGCFSRKDIGYRAIRREQRYEFND